MKQVGSIFSYLGSHSLQFFATCNKINMSLLILPTHSQFQLLKRNNIIVNIFPSFISEKNASFKYSDAKQQAEVYEITANDCQSVYIRQTKWVITNEIQKALKNIIATGCLSVYRARYTYADTVECSKSAGRGNSTFVPAIKSTHQRK